jgi:5-methylcytosine-specific restriction protein A
MRDQRPSARQRGYTARWERYRLHFLRANPLCAMCQREGRVVPATVVDHVTPHKGDQALFWDPANHQALCKPHHDSTKQRQERRGFVSGSTVEGRPIDPDHPWNRARN